MRKFITIIKGNKKLLLLISLARFIMSSSLRGIKGGKRKYPKVIQLPITYKCNSRCVMCNIWKMGSAHEASINEFRIFLQDDIFKKVEAVGINGGEPTLLLNLVDYAEAILELPKIKSLNIISNGFRTDIVLDKIESIYGACKKKGVNFHVAFSLDGYTEIHNTVRGKDVFKRTTATIDKLISNIGKYCDSYDLGCTIVKQNVNYLIQLDEYCKKKNYNIKYRLGIDNKRIESDKLRNQYSVIYSPLKQSALEFFIYQLTQTKELGKRFKYYAIMKWLSEQNPKRLLGCIWKDEGITMDARGDLYYCAVASKNIGGLRHKKGEDIFFNPDNIKHRQEIISDNCDSCIHDYNGKVKLSSILTFLSDTFTEIYGNKLAMNLYKIKARLL
ncbi:radical SAM protein [Carboxylicivirga marina]|uniref:Radical SAM protein n=1 Tax=Carboxylicivirga marina TaxID=2800988 RepID=A0ABS1HL62_9BACT|nr:radical SAM protein [Carboxylicivirga marina]MBK3518008.1 radical SAM protein [Carboxylicivirga marina]